MGLNIYEHFFFWTDRKLKKSEKNLKLIESNDLIIPNWIKEQNEREKKRENNVGVLMKHNPINTDKRSASFCHVQKFAVQSVEREEEKNKNK